MAVHSGHLRLTHRRVMLPSQVRRLVHYMRRTTRRNLTWYLSQRKIWPIRCSDNVWRQCVEALACDADVILIDVSDVNEHVRWELTLCRDRHLLDRVVLLVSEERLDAVERGVAEGFYAVRPPKPYVYGRKSLVDVGGLVDEVARIVARGQAARALLQPPSWGGAVLARAFGWVVLALAGVIVVAVLDEGGRAGVVLATLAIYIPPLLVCCYFAVTGGRLLARDGSARRRALVGTAGGALVTALDAFAFALTHQISSAALVTLLAIAALGAGSAVIVAVEARLIKERAQPTAVKTSSTP